MNTSYYSSYYGGAPGYSFIIAKSYKTVDDMKADFKTANCSVHNGEYVLISAESSEDNYDFIARQNPDNGRIYYKQNDNTAKFIGTIIGPSGIIPAIKIKDYNAVKDMYNSLTPEEQEVNGSISSMTDQIMLVPGKDGNTFNDKIEWVCTNMTDDSGKTAIAAVGFKIPYTVIDFSTKVVAPTDEPSVVDLTPANTPHPFYRTYQLNIPMSNVIGYYTDLSNIVSGTFSADEFVDYLNNTYPDGIVEDDFKGYGVVYGNSGENIKHLYIFDHSGAGKQWIKIQDLESATSTTRRVVLDKIQEPIEHLNYSVKYDEDKNLYNFTLTKEQLDVFNVVFEENKIYTLKIQSDALCARYLNIKQDKEKVTFSIKPVNKEDLTYVLLIFDLVGD